MQGTTDLPIFGEGTMPVAIPDTPPRPSQSQGPISRGFFTTAELCGSGVIPLPGKEIVGYGPGTIVSLQGDGRLGDPFMAGDAVVGRVVGKDVDGRVKVALSDVLNMVIDRRSREAHPTDLRSVNVGVEKLFELGRRGPYFRTLSFPTGYPTLGPEDSLQVKYTVEHE